MKDDNAENNNNGEKIGRKIREEERIKRGKRMMQKFQTLKFS